MKKQNYKIVILGAGVGGLSLALYLLKNNIDDFVVLNVTNHNTHKACTGLLINKTCNILKELDISLDGYSIVTNFHTSFNGSKNKNLPLNNIQAYFHKDTGRVYLNNALYEKCISQNVEIIEDCGNIEIDDKKKLVSFLNETVGFEYVVDARGFFPDIAKEKEKDIGFEVKFQHEPTGLNSDVEVILSDSIKGYGWVVLGNEYDVVGFTDEYKNGTNYQNILKEFISKFYGRNNKQVDSKMAFIPVHVSKLIVNKSHLQIGDKAGLVDPLTQEGIYYAIYSAKQAAIAISNEDINLYESSMKEIVKSFKFATMTRRLFFSKKHLEKMWNMISKHQFLEYLFQRYSNDDYAFYYHKLKSYRKDYKNGK